MPLPDLIVRLDGHAEPTVFAVWRTPKGEPIYAPVIRRRDLPPNVRHLWVGIADRLTGLRIMTMLREHVAWLLYCLNEGYRTAEDRAALSNWLLDDESILTAHDRALKADLLAMADEILAALANPGGES